MALNNNTLQVDWKMTDRKMTDLKKDLSKIIEESDLQSSMNHQSFRLGQSMKNI